MAKKDFLEITYDVCKEFYNNQLPRQAAIDKLANDGMNPGSAIINIQMFKHLMNGEKFTRTLSAITFEYFLKKILQDFGPAQLVISLEALSKHIDYMEATRGYTMGLVRVVYVKYGNIGKALSSAESDEELEESLFPEGKEKYRLHRYKERNSNLIKSAKRAFKQMDQKMKCQVCKISFVDEYGELGEDYIEAHHVFPISELKVETETKIEDIAMVCANCHRMLHRKRPWLGIENLRMLRVVRTT
ncbi:MAG: HNH endonuclease [Ferruginibacter sp.]